MKFVHLHIPKTAGTSLRENITLAHPELNVSYVIVSDNISAEDQKGPDVVSGHISYDQARQYGDQIVTVLRHPIDRFVSVYYFWKKLFENSVEDTRKTRLAATLSLYEFAQAFDEPELASELYNRMTWQLHSDFRLMKRYGVRMEGVGKRSQLVDRALENLRGFAVVGFQGEFGKFVDQVNHKFGMQIKNTEINTTKNRIAIENLSLQELSAIMKWVGRVDKRDSQGALNVIQAGICDGDQLGTRPDVGRGMGLSRALHSGDPSPERAEAHEPSCCSGWNFLGRANGVAVA